MKNDQIFATHAPQYWDRDLSVFFIEPGKKSPPRRDSKGWQGFCNNLPSHALREKWLRNHAHDGIALLTGMEVRPGLRIAAVDVDDDRLVSVTEIVLGECLCAKKASRILCSLKPSLNQPH